MSESNFPTWHSIHTIVFDFDGVFTDNKVWVNQDGTESVVCDRGDGLAFDMLRSFIAREGWNLNYFILSKEKNPVVLKRAEKLKIACVQSTSNKSSYLQKYLEERRLLASGLIFVGNDLNDLSSMIMSGYSVAPSDSHPLILNTADYIFSQKGGQQFVRAFIEKLLGIDCMNASQFLANNLI